MRNHTLGNRILTDTSRYKKVSPTIEMRNELHSKMFLPTVITALHNDLRRSTAF